MIYVGGEHFNDSCHLYSMENSWWEQELHPYNQYEEKKRLSNLENVLMQFMETSEANFKANQHAIQNLEIQVGKLAKEVAKIPFLVTREEKFEEVKAHEESLVEEHDSRERDEQKEEKSKERTQQQWKKCSQVEIQQQERILQVNTPPHQLIGKEERHIEYDKSLSVILSLNTNTSLAMVWKAFPGYMSFMESLAKR